MKHLPCKSAQVIGEHNHRMEVDDTDTFAVIEVRASPAIPLTKAPPVPPDNNSVTFTIPTIVGNSLKHTKVVPL